MSASTPMAIGHVVRMTMFQTLFGQRLLNVFYLRCTVAPTSGTSYFAAMEALATRFANTGVSPLLEWIPLVADELEFDFVRCQRVNPTRDIYAQVTVGADGSHLAPAEMSNVAISIEKRSLTFGPQGVGRMQIGGIPGTVITAGKFDGSYQVLAQSLADTFLGDQTVAGGLGTYRFCLYNGTVPTDEDDYFDMIVHDTARTMHRRTLRVGE